MLLIVRCKTEKATQTFTGAISWGCHKHSGTSGNTAADSSMNALLFHPQQLMVERYIFVGVPVVGELVGIFLHDPFVLRFPQSVFDRSSHLFRLEGIKIESLVAENFGQTAKSRCEDLRAHLQRLDAGDAEAFQRAGEEVSLAVLVEPLLLLVCDGAGKDDTSFSFLFYNLAELGCVWETVITADEELETICTS